MDISKMTLPELLELLKEIAEEIELRAMEKEGEDAEKE